MTNDGITNESGRTFKHPSFRHSEFVLHFPLAARNQINRHIFES
jgi:hypothetical protein